MTANGDGATLADRVPGERVVLTVYMAVVGVTAVLGALLGIVNPEGLDPELFFLVDLPPTPLGMVIFGVTTVGGGLGVLLLGVRFVSRYDSARVE